jgi:uncharacterized repeat protein (TIGR03803 family)
MRNLISNKVIRIAFASAPILVLVLLALPAVYGQTFTVLHTFAGGIDGGTPLATPVLYNGSVYGTASAGGAHNNGAVYQYDVTPRTENTVHSFAGAPDGADPVAGLVQDSANNFYGVTYRGGAHGCGTAFKLTPAGVFSLLHSFTGPTAQGCGPAGTLIFDPLGNLFGTTYSGGSTAGYGTVFEILANLTYKTGQSFPPAGAVPRGGLHLQGGKLYGTTTGGGAGLSGGTIFEVTGTTPLYTFTGGTDGAEPAGSLVGDGGNNLYGTTSAGGTGTFGLGSGVVFQYNTSTQKESVLHTFSGSDGATPVAGLVRDSHGNLYGTTTLGGASGYGTVFKLDTSLNLTTVYSFTGQGDGGKPYAGVIVDSAGNIWGATSIGGSVSAPGGYGTLFIIAPPPS